jgi:hypothetical protein
VQRKVVHLGRRAPKGVARRHRRRRYFTTTHIHFFFFSLKEMGFNSNVVFEKRKKKGMHMIFFMNLRICVGSMLCAVGMPQVKINSDQRKIGERLNTEIDAGGCAVGVPGARGACGPRGWRRRRNLPRRAFTL